MKRSAPKLFYNQDCKRAKKPLPDNAILLFVSHRWFSAIPDDENFTDWKLILDCIDSLIHLCIDMCGFFCSSLEMSLDRIKEICSLPLSEDFTFVNEDAMISTNLLFDILYCAAHLGTEQRTDVKEWCDALASHVLLWIDFFSLPQNIPAILRRNSCDDARFDNTLSELGPLQQQMHTIVVTNDRYLESAWCAAENVNESRSISYTNQRNKLSFKNGSFSLRFFRKRESCIAAFLNFNLPGSLEILQHLELQYYDDPNKTCEVMWNYIRDRFSNLHSITISISSADCQMITLAVGNYDRVFEYLEFLSKSVPRLRN